MGEGDIYYNSSGVLVRKSVIEDVKYLSERLRQSDLEEIWASNHLCADSALHLSYFRSLVCLTVVYGQEPVCMFGVCPQTLLGNKGVVWMLGSDALTKHSLRLARHSRKFIAMFLDLYSVIFNYVHDKNKESIAWLKMCGAKINDPAPYGLEQENFRFFSFERN